LLAGLFLFCDVGRAPMLGYIANEEENCQGNFIMVSVEPNGESYTVSIPAKQITRSYKTRSR
jgi:hypothetical protein